MRVGVWILALAAVPLGGAIWFAANEVRQVNESSQQAEAVADATAELVQLTELRARLLDERNWALALNGVEAINIDPALLSSFVGIDFAQLRGDAQTSVDELLIEVGWPGLIELIDEVRADENNALGQDPDGYAALAAVVEEQSDRSLDSLLTVGGSISDGADLVAALRALEASSVARQAVTLQLTSYFRAQFIGSGWTSEVQILSQQQAEYLDAMADVDRVTSEGSNARMALDAVNASDDVAVFRTAISNLRATPPSTRGAEEGGLVDVNGALIDVESIVGQLDAISETLSSAVGSIEQHLALVDAASSDVLTASGSIEEAAAAASRRALTRVGIIAAASLLFAMGLARAIRRPLRQLSERAEDLRDGKGLAAIRPSGPTEIRETMHALNEAAAHLELAERQANALALGQLDDPALSESSPGALGESLQEAVQTLTSSLSEREQLGALLSHEASHDSLTQLPNRRASLDSLHQGLARSSRTGATVAIMFLDLDGFKQVNDRHGHAAGDTLLRAVAERLANTLRDGDHVGRLGGDEFLVVAEPIAGAAEAVALAQRLINSISKPIAVGPASVRVGASVGIALADGETTLSADELLRDADLAVYKAKGSGSSLIQLCDESLRTELDTRADVESALRTAIQLDELTMHYQPIIDANTLQVLSLEALVRWERPGVGLVPPDDFIPIAERSDLILAVDNWVVRNVIDQLSRWTNNDTFAHLPVAINVSGRHLGSDSFVNDVLEPLERTGVRSERVIIEVTESALLDDLDVAAVKLQQLRDRGISVAIDDFGTGYTSLGHLRTLPVNILKIDRTFTADKSAHSLVKLIIDTGHLLGLRIIAEGIETPEQASDLAKMGSDELQGYLFACPAPVGAIRLPQLEPVPNPAID